MGRTHVLIGAGVTTRERGVSSARLASAGVAAIAAQAIACGTAAALVMVRTDSFSHVDEHEREKYDRKPECRDENYRSGGPSRCPRPDVRHGEHDRYHGDHGPRGVSSRAQRLRRTSPTAVASARVAYSIATEPASLG